MVQPARRFDIWRRLYSRFLIEPLPVQDSESPGVATVIQPTTDADELLKRHGQFFTATASFNANGRQVGVTVPDGERWDLHILRAGAASGDRTITQWLLFDVSETLVMVIDIFTAAQQATLILPAPIPMEEGDHLDVFSDAGTTATVYNIDVWRSAQDAF